MDKPYSNLGLGLRFLRFYRKALDGKGHGIHSPFVFDFVRSVLNNFSNYQTPESIENLRALLLTNHSEIEQIEMGAGTRTNSNTRTVASMARSALKPKRLAELMFRLSRHYSPSSILELGTSFGLTTAYLAEGNRSAEILTIEGNPETAFFAEQHFQLLDIANIELLTGNFDEVLPALLSERRSPFGLVYVDGNHRYEPTVRYFEMLLPFIDDQSILVFDDIHWSPGMEKAWEMIRSHPSVVYSIDIFFMGFVFFRKDFRVKQRFDIRF